MFGRPLCFNVLATPLPRLRLDHAHCTQFLAFRSEPGSPFDTRNCLRQVIGIQRLLRGHGQPLDGALVLLCMFEMVGEHDAVALAILFQVLAGEQGSSLPIRVRGTSRIPFSKSKREASCESGGISKRASISRAVGPSTWIFPAGAPSSRRAALPATSCKDSLPPDSVRLVLMPTLDSGKIPFRRRARRAACAAWSAGMPSPAKAMVVSPSAIRSALTQIGRASCR